MKATFGYSGSRLPLEETQRQRPGRSDDLLSSAARFLRASKACSKEGEREAFVVAGRPRMEFNSWETEEETGKLLSVQCLDCKQAISISGGIGCHACSEGRPCWAIPDMERLGFVSTTDRGTLVCSFCLKFVSSDASKSHICPSPVFNSFVVDVSSTPVHRHAIDGAGKRGESSSSAASCRGFGRDTTSGDCDYSPYRDAAVLRFSASVVLVCMERMTAGPTRKRAATSSSCIDACHLLIAPCEALSHDKGLDRGAFALHPIKANSCVGLYTGILVDPSTSASDSVNDIAVRPYKAKTTYVIR